MLCSGKATAGRARGPRRQSRMFQFNGEAILPGATTDSWGAGN